MPPGLSTSDFYYILPELVLTGGALLVLIADVLLPIAGPAVARVGVFAGAAQVASHLPSPAGGSACRTGPRQA